MKETVLANLSRGQHNPGDLIPWTVTQQFQDYDFGHLSGARVVRIATHPDYQRVFQIQEKHVCSMLTPY